ncbi:alpha/beta hydrolase [Sphingomonas sp.]|jgi:pimeloyl-ACP methyl ester carboxylesterase|uniref:alpha/beta fold hydrolase n=1 Tax=Sphingomonas sp. TaxID=28214 RepID=UPI002E31AAB1|nr:alpha/beta hydrolase [Sphingomonas sp.]HEX4693276.1 alpha/beta hydrolase [Sphingomonas sp.]
MTPASKARFIAAIAFPALAFNVAQAHAAPHAVPQAARMPVSAIYSAEVRMPHISVVTAGKGSPVILIPGLSSPRAVWEDAAAKLAANHRVYLVQVNGFGGDDPGANLAPGILPGVVADLDAYIAKNKLQGAAVVGHSMGGLLGLMLAKAHPADVGKLMIVDSLPWYGILFGPTATVAMVEPQAKAMRDGMAASYGKPNPQAQMIASKLALKPDSQAKLLAWMDKADARVSAEAMYEDLMTDLRGDMAGIATPITMLFPTSAALPKAVAEPIYHGAYKDAPHVTFIDVEDSAHFIMLDQPAAFEAALMAFVG